MIIHYIEEENMWTDVRTTMCFIPLWWGEEAQIDDFYYEYYL